MGAVHEYYAALRRLVNDKPSIVPKGSPINKTTVALEAGRTRGSIRNREGFQQLIKDIKIAGSESPKKRSSPDSSNSLLEAKTEIDRLKQENNTLKSRYMSLLYLNLEMSREMVKYNLRVPKFGGVTDINIDIRDTTEKNR